MEDLEIIALYTRRDEGAIAQTDAKYGKLCRRVAIGILGDAGDAEECVNDAYLGVWNAIPPARPDSLMAFIARITRNLSLKRVEAMSRQKRAAAALLSLDELAEVLPDESIADDFRDEDIGAAISRFLGAERETVRNVFIRKYYYFDSIGEIAKRYGYTEAKVKSMLFHTRSRLKKYLIKEGIEL